MKPARSDDYSVTKGTEMNWDRIASSWEQTRASLKQKWAKLTDDDLGLISGKKDMLVAKLHERYGVAKDKAESQINEWLASLDRPK
jgi:uncharacterized protein YjbJ (UPF0337 family)